MKRCPSCGYENEDNAKFCTECGEKFAETPRYCTNCGTRLDPGTKFCPHCGVKVGAEAAKERPEWSAEKESSRMPAAEERPERSAAKERPGMSAADEMREMPTADWEDDDRDERRAPFFILTGVAVFGAVLMIIGLILMVTMG